jgi:hypothetical protein
MESIFPSNYITFIFKFLLKTVFVLARHLCFRCAFCCTTTQDCRRAKRNGSFVQVSLSSSVIETDYIVCEVQRKRNSSLSATFCNIQIHPTYTGCRSMEDTWHYENWTVRCDWFEEQRQVVQLESWYWTRLLKRDFNQLPLENCNLHYFLNLRGKNGDCVNNRQFC